MFRNAIQSTPFTSEIANDYFPNIRGDSCNGDVSFLSTMRALLAKRMTADDKLYLHFSTTSYTASALQGASTRDCVSVITSCTHVRDCGSFIVHNLSASEEDNLANMRILESGFEKYHDGYHQLKKIAVFFQKSFPALCFVNPELRSTVLYVSNLDMRKLHYIQQVILPAMPWYFDPKASMSELEMELLDSLRVKTSSEPYETCLAKLAAEYDFRSLGIKRYLQGFETRFDRQKCEELRAAIADNDRRIDDYNQRIMQIINERQDKCVRLLGLESKIAQDSNESEIMDYFLCNRSLYLDSVEGSRITFCVSTYLSYYDKEVVERMISNKTSFVYTPAIDDIEPARMVKLLRAIFIDESIRIKVCAAYQLSVNHGVEPFSHYQFPAELKLYMPNPHINQYRCMGNYSPTINRLLANYDYVGAIEQCAASCKSLNWTDSTVMSTFMADMYRSQYQCIELPDGSVVKPLQAIEWLEAQEEEADGPAKAEEETHE